MTSRGAALNLLCDNLSIAMSAAIVAAVRIEIPLLQHKVVVSTPLAR
jgi:hypothetical protein